jgi:enoyl-CoA hydratase
MPLVTLERSGPVAVITLNRPDVRNAINLPMAQAIGQALDQLEEDAELRVAVLTASVTEPRPVFCAGDDLRAINGDPAVTPRGGFAGIVTYPRTKPLIAAVDGLATSGGCEIVLACDLVVATPRSSFALAEITWGLAPLAGGCIRLPRLIGRAPAMDLILTGQPMSAERAYQLGLVSTLTEGDVLEAALERARIIAQYDPGTIAINLELVHRAATLGEAELWSINAAAAQRVMGSPAMMAGMAAFEDRRH